MSTVSVESLEQNEKNNKQRMEYKSKSSNALNFCFSRMKLELRYGLVAESLNDNGKNSNSLGILLNIMLRTLKSELCKFKNLNDFFL